ncbi:hypothetical protein EJ08DRAFT_678519 [Tothia fuscella]|uniref:Uncharacterized protein n=1 Tax=Tothia fuscella TaxID=1048955 RepID=A0A9P4NTS2_9PEZI|nr:hypothetical protein EJ08DRAFT_678519 [Tothia fuscella]
MSVCSPQMNFPPWQTAKHQTVKQPKWQTTKRCMTKMRCPSLLSKSYIMKVPDGESPFSILVIQTKEKSAHALPKESKSITGQETHLCGNGKGGSLGKDGNLKRKIVQLSTIATRLLLLSTICQRGTTLWHRIMAMNLSICLITKGEWSVRYYPGSESNRRSGSEFIALGEIL